MPPIHMPAWPVSTTTMESSGTCCVSSLHSRSGRNGIGGKQGLVFFPPLPANSPCLFDPNLALGGTATIGRRQHEGKRNLGIAVDGGAQGVIAPEGLRVDV